MITIKRTQLPTACFELYAAVESWSILLSFHGCGILLRSGLLCVDGDEEVFEMILKWESLDVDNDHHQQESSFQIIDTAGLR